MSSLEEIINGILVINIFELICLFGILMIVAIMANRQSKEVKHGSDDLHG